MMSVVFFDTQLKNTNSEFGVSVFSLILIS